jgi:hypothetical protein
MPLRHDPRFLEFLRLYNAAEYYESHETLEDLWLDEHGPLRPFYQGMIQYSTAFLHLEKGNLSGCRKLLIQAKGKLSAYPDICHGIDLRVVHGAIDWWLVTLEAAPPGEAVPYDAARIPRLDLWGETE